jgi:RimJ/RimL family protein N-acetyltransferase
VDVPTLATDRLLLREWRDADRTPFAELNADPDVARFLNGPRDRAESDALIDRISAHWAEHGFGLWALERREDGRFIGFTGLYRPAFEAHFTPAVEVGWRLAREAWGLGYATEAGRAALAYGFETVGLDELVSFTVPANVRSRAVMERLGMRRDAADDFDHPRFEQGHPLRRHVLYRLRRHDWERAHAAGATTPRKDP